MRRCHMVLDELEIETVTQLMVPGTEGLPEPRTSTSFPDILYPRLGRGRRKDCVHLWVFQRTLVF